MRRGVTHSPDTQRSALVRGTLAGVALMTCVARPGTAAPPRTASPADSARYFRDLVYDLAR